MSNIYPKDIIDLYEVFDFKNAAAILAKEFPEEFDELCAALHSASKKTA